MPRWEVPRWVEDSVEGKFAIKQILSVLYLNETADIFLLSTKAVASVCNDGATTM